MKKIVSKKIKTKIRNMNKKIVTIDAVVILFLVGAFFSVLIWRLELLEIIETKVIATPVNYSREKIQQGNMGENNNGHVYENKDLGFSLMLPKDERRYAYKEISPKGQNSAIVFGLPTTDAEIKKAKKADYSEIFRIELVPVSDLGKKACADSSRSFPLCDNDDQELGRGAEFVFVYTRYDKLDSVEKAEAKLIPDDFGPEVFAQADEIAKSFRFIQVQVGLAL